MTKEGAGFVSRPLLAERVRQECKVLLLFREPCWFPLVWRGESGVCQRIGLAASL